MADANAALRGYRFGAFEVDLRAGELRKQGMKIKVQDQPFRVLALLLERPNDVVTREELRQTLWPTDTFVDFDHSVNTAITRLRDALGDSADNPRFIETLPRHGYRFIAEVQPILSLAAGAAQAAGAAPGSLPYAPPPASPAPPSPPPAPLAQPVAVEFPPPAVQPPRPSSGLRYVGFGLLALAALLAGYFARDRFMPRPQPPPGKIMLAVLPFENLDADPAQEYFSDGLTEEMITQLGHLEPERLGVIARTSAMNYRHTRKSAREIAKELGVSYLLEGSVRRSAGRVRIAAQLIQVSDQTHLWAESYESDLSDILDVQSKVARAIADQIRVQFAPHKQGRLKQERARKIGPVNPEAYEACLKGRHFWNRRTEEGFLRSIEYFEQAIRKDPQYALARAWLADAYNLLGFYGVLPPAQTYPKAKAAAAKALALDDTLAEAHASLADVSYLYNWDWSSAEREFKRAIELNPNYATAHQWYGAYLALEGRLEESASEIEQARTLDPLSLTINVEAGTRFYYARQYDQAIEKYRRTIELDPNYPLAHIWLGRAYAQKSLWNESIAEFQTTIKLSEGNPLAVALLGHAYGTSGQRNEAQKALSELVKMSGKRYISPVCFALVHLGLGDENRALDWMEKAYKERSGLLVRLKMEPLPDGLRSDPRFQKLLRRIGPG